MFEKLWRIIAGIEPPEDLETPAVLRAATHSIVLRLDPTRLENPDLEIRWDIERLLEAVTPKIRFVEDGFGYAKNSDAIFLAYATDEPERLIAVLIKLLDEEVVCNNRLGSAAMVALAPRLQVTAAGRELEHHKVVYPAADAGKPLPD